MPKTLILKDVPDELYERLKLSAQMRRRSMSSVAIVCLAAALLPGKLTPTERLARARALRAELQNGEFRGRDIDAAKREGRA